MTIDDSSSPTPPPSDTPEPALVPSLPAEDAAMLASSAASLLDLAIAAWLDAAYRRGQSARTVEAYQETITRFRAVLASMHLDLDADPRAVALMAQRWAWQRWRGAGTKPVAPATAAMRLNILSSFYAFAIKRGLGGILVNPIDQLDRPRVQAYAKARALPPETVQQALHAVRRAADRGDLLALRDLAYLRLALTTGRRLAELAGLRRRDLTITPLGSTTTITVAWRAKGGKLLYDLLAPDVAADLRAWLETWYGCALETLPDDAPIWGPPHAPGTPLTAQACGDIVRRHLHTHPHATRHTFAHAMRRVGARDSEIQLRLGHSSLATTGRYLAGLDSAVNPYADALATLFRPLPTTPTEERQ